MVVARGVVADDVLFLSSDVVDAELINFLPPTFTLDAILADNFRRFTEAAAVMQFSRPLVNTASLMILLQLLMAFSHGNMCGLVVMVLGHSLH